MINITNLGESGLIPHFEYPSCLGDFGALPDEMIARIFSYIQPLDLGSPIRLVCRDFQRIFQNPATTYFYLESQLEKTTTLTFTEIESYRASFRQKHQEELSLGTLFSKCLKLNCLDLSQSTIDRSALAAILQAAQQCCTLYELNVKNCKRLTGEPPLGGLIHLEFLRLNGSSGLTGRLELDGMKELQILNLTGCTKLTGLSSLHCFSRLTFLNLGGSTWLKGKLDLNGLNELEFLYLIDCKKLKGFMNLHKIKKLQILHLMDCIRFTGELDLEGLNGLQTVKVNGCRRLTSLLHLNTLPQLTHLDLSDCPGLAGIDLSGLPSEVEITQ